MADGRSRVACVVVTYDALPWIERCLASVAGSQTIVVDNGSSDGTPDVVRERFPRVRVVEERNRGLAAGWNRGIAEADAEHVLVLNADAWLVDDALARLVDAADRHPRAAAVGPRLLNPDGSLQRSVRGFPTTWRLATEYLYLRKLAPGSRALNAFYGAGFDHESERAVDWVMGACFLLRRSAYDEVGPFDERYFLFSEEVDWMRRATDAGWKSCSRRRRGASTSAAPRTAGACSARTSAGTCATCRSTGGPERRRRRGSSCARRFARAAGCTAASAAASTGRQPPGSARATSTRCSRMRPNTRR